MPKAKRPYGRRSIRLTGYDHTSPGVYFITICTQDRENLFAHRPFREAAENAWRNIPKHPHAAPVTRDEWIVMPNHIHRILVINDSVDRGARKAGWIRHRLPRFAPRLPRPNRNESGVCG
jgi:REP element-mobilizing transposase RayT